MKQNISITAYITTLIIATCLIIVGRVVVSESGTEHTETHIFRGVVTEVIDNTLDEEWDIQTLNAVVTLADETTVMANQSAMGNIIEYTRFAEVGDRVIVEYFDNTGQFSIVSYQRIWQIAIIISIIALAILIYGRKKGLNGLISLVFTCLSIFLVFIPAVLNGYNIYLFAILICLYSTGVTLILVLGTNMKSYAAILGTLGSLLFSGLVMLLVNSFLGLTGLIDGQTLSILVMGIDIDLSGLLFSSILIGSVGAVMDIATSIASALWEIERVRKQTFREHIISGFNIGQDALGTMLNTLILAYIGGSLSTVIFFAFTNNSTFRLLNEEVIISEFLRGIIGSLGIFLAIPVTTILCAWLFSRERISEFKL